jgi:hypothetical protein
MISWRATQMVDYTLEIVLWLGMESVTDLACIGRRLLTNAAKTGYIDA